MLAKEARLGTQVLPQKTQWVAIYQADKDFDPKLFEALIRMAMQDGETKIVWTWSKNMKTDYGRAYCEHFAELVEAHYEGLGYRVHVSFAEISIGQHNYRMEVRIDWS